MNDTGWYLKDIDEAQHAVPYSSMSTPRILTSADKANASIGSKYYGRCLYSFPNYPDGPVRTSVNDLSKFLRAYIGMGQADSARILKEATVRTMLTVSHNDQGLCWANPTFLDDDPIMVPS